MEEYSWPGNVRELKNVVERMVILSQGNVIRASEQPFRAPWRPGRVSIGDEPLDLRLRESFSENTL